MLSNPLNVALKEWDTVCRALASGRQIILLRKGGIHESSSGFELEHQHFLLFPTFVHQNSAMLKPDALENVQTHSTEPSCITLTCAAEVTNIIRLKYRQQMDAIEQEHIWLPPLIDMRFNYKPQNPLYLLIARAYKLARPVTIDNTPAYSGCKSWVPMDHTIEVSGASPALDDATFDRRSRVVIDRLGVQAIG